MLRPLMTDEVPVFRCSSKPEAATVIKKALYIATCTCELYSTKCKDRLLKENQNN